MTDKWVRSSANAYAYVVGVLTCYAYSKYVKLMLVLMLMR